MTPTTEKRARLRALLAAATPGPWDPCLGSGHNRCTALRSEYGGLLCDFQPDWFLAEGYDRRRDYQPDMDLVVAAVNALPALLDEREEAEAALRGSQEALQYVVDENNALRAQRDGLREALLAKGYHAPQNGGRCQHGMKAWVGSHCKYDCAALAAVDKEG